MKLILSFLIIVVVIILCLHTWRWFDNRKALQNWADLEMKAGISVGMFDPDTVQHLPDPARRFFLYTIQPGTPLYTVSEVETGGEIGLGPKEKPGYMPMRGVQILAPPYGYVWRLTAGRGLMKLIGNEGANDNQSWIRFWAAGTVPVVRAGGEDDHFRAAFGRMIADGIFWTPAAMLPQFGAVWTPVNATTAKVTLSHYGLEQSINVTVGPDGQPRQIEFQRWSDVNPENEYRYQSFGGTLHDFRDFSGYKLPTRVEAGNHFGTDEYFPFYKAIVENIEFPQAGAR